MEFFSGTRWRIEAHYPNAADKVTEIHETENDAFAAKTKHHNAGANVQMTRLRWELTATPSGWYEHRK